MIIKQKHLSKLIKKRRFADRLHDFQTIQLMKCLRAQSTNGVMTVVLAAAGQSKIAQPLPNTNGITVNAIFAAVTHTHTLTRVCWFKKIK